MAWGPVLTLFILLPLRLILWATCMLETELPIQFVKFRQVSIHAVVIRCLVSKALINAVAGVVTTYAGQALKSSLTNGLGTNALFQSPSSIAVASNLTIYVADSSYVRQISSSGMWVQPLT
jgi:hypothetical protein